MINIQLSLLIISLFHISSSSEVIRNHYRKTLKEYNSQIDGDDEQASMQHESIFLRVGGDRDKNIQEVHLAPHYHHFDHKLHMQIHLGAN
jgi:hypothetical protein